MSLPDCVYFPSFSMRFVFFYAKGFNDLMEFKILEF